MVAKCNSIASISLRLGFKCLLLQRSNPLYLVNGMLPLVNGIFQPGSMSASGH
jgi:hypothetical protein